MHLADAFIQSDSQCIQAIHFLYNFCTINTRNCTADNILVEPQHISDHFFIIFKLPFATCMPPPLYRLLLD